MKISQIAGDPLQTSICDLCNPHFSINFRKCKERLGIYYAAQTSVNTSYHR